MKRIIKFGIYSGVAMWIFLFIGGAIFARKTYSADMCQKGSLTKVR